MAIFETKMKCHFLQRCVVLFFRLCFYKKYFFCFLSYSPQCQKNSFRISGVHGTLSSQIIPLQYTILGIECQVRITLILFYYFSQHFITIFCATSHRYIFARFTSLYIKEETPYKNAIQTFKILVLQDILRSFFLRTFTRTT